LDARISRPRGDPRKLAGTSIVAAILTAVKEYIIGVAQKYELYRYIRFNTVVDEAHWDDTEEKWKTSVTVTGAKDAEFGEHYTLTSDFLVSAVGQLNIPKTPDIPGITDFKGKIMHSSRWDWSYDLKGKKIAIIGNGATAAQIIPELAKVAEKLTVHQRTPNWVIPRADAPIPVWRRALFKYVPPVRWRYRAEMMDFRESFYDAITDKNTPFADLLVNMSKGMMKAQLPDRPDLYECPSVRLTGDFQD
jgi:cation diffusion facilitator CzcD-associated flavoprotein CzcO